MYCLLLLLLLLYNDIRIRLMACTMSLANHSGAPIILLPAFYTPSAHPGVLHCFTNKILFDVTLSGIGRYTRLPYTRLIQYRVHDILTAETYIILYITRVAVCNARRDDCAAPRNTHVTPHTRLALILCPPVPNIIQFHCPTHTRYCCCCYYYYCYSAGTRGGCA